MTIELDWQEGEDQPGVTWEGATASLPFAPAARQTIAEGERPRARLPRRLLRLLAILLAIPLVVGAAAGVALFARADQGNELARRDIQATVDMLRAAQTDGDAVLAASLIDLDGSPWKAEIIDHLIGPTASPVPSRLEVASVRLDGRRALAAVSEFLPSGSAVVKQVAFRLDGDRWIMTRPRPDDFGAAGEAESPHFRIHYRQRDEPLVSYMINALEGAYVTLCSDLRCAPGQQLIELELQYGEADPALQPSSDVAVPSPQILGLDANGQPIATFEEAVVERLGQHLALAKVPGASSALLAVLGDWASSSLLDPHSREDVQRTLQGAAESGLLLPLGAGWQAVVIGDDATDPMAAAQVHSLLAFAQEVAGNDAVGRMLEALNVTQDFDVLVRRVFNVDSDRLQARWLAWLAQENLTSPGLTTG